MMPQFSVSLVVSFYKEIERLGLILSALQRQSFGDFEVIIADDGSPPEITSLVKKYITESSLSIQHVWHEDIGFRKTMILNEALRRSQSAYIIFIDGDCVPHYRFVEDHFKSREKNVLLAGRRVNLSANLTKRINVQNINAGAMEKASFPLTLIFDSIGGETVHAEKGIRIGNPIIRKLLNSKIAGVLGCNFSMHREDILKINGFDERYHAPAYGEDLDPETRFGWAGGHVRMLKNMGIIYHLYHPRLPHRHDNKPIFEAVLIERMAYTPFGINKT